MNVAELLQGMLWAHNSVMASISWIYCWGIERETEKFFEKWKRQLLAAALETLE